MHTIKFNYKNHYISLLVLLALAGAFLFSSCENFLDDKNVSDEILDTIAYNNAPDCNVLFQADNEMGKFLTGENIIFKVGYNSEVQFSLNKNDYIFTGLEAVSKTNPDKSLADYVSISNKEADEEKGIYTFDVKVTKKTSDLMIRPVCFAYLSVTSYSPDSNEAQFANTPVVISFNMPMINDDTNTVVEITKDNLQILAGKVPLSDYFDHPVFNDDRTKLTIYPKSEELQEYIHSLMVDYIQIQFILSENIKVNFQGHTLSLKQDFNSNFKINYKAQIDTTPPQKSNFFVTRHPITIESAETIQPQDRFVLEAFETESWASHISYETYQKTERNKSSGIIYIYGKYSDTNPGVASVTIGETVYNSQNAEFFDDGHGITTFCIKHILTTPGDNILDCYVSDYSGNMSEHINFNAFYKTLDASRIFVYNFSDDANNFRAQDFDMENYTANRKIIKIPYDWDESIGHDCNALVSRDLYYKKFNSVIEDVDYYSNFTIKYEYKDKDGTTKIGDLTNDKNNKIFYHELENVDKLNGLRIKLTVIDELDNHDESEVIFPVPSTITSITKNGNTATMNFAPIAVGQSLIEGTNDEDGYSFPTQILLYEENGISKTTTYDSSFVIKKDINYKVIPIQIDNVGDYAALFGDIGTEEYTIDSTVNTIADVVLNGQPTYKQGSSVYTGDGINGGDNYKHLMDITVKIADNSWDNFDFIYLVHNWQYGYGTDTYFTETYCFKENEYELTFPFEIYYMYQNDTTFTIYGIKDSFQSPGLVCKIDKLTAEQDYNPPSATFTPSENNINNNTIITINFNDSESGPDYAYVQNFTENGNYKYILNESNNFKVEIPLWELSENEKLRYSNYPVVKDIKIYVIGYDKKENRGISSCRIRTVANYYYHYPNTPDTTHNKQYDLLIPNGGSTTKSLAISSNAKVMVHTLVTTAPYSECKDWSIYEWEHYKKTLNQQELTFSSSNHNLQRYDIPYDKIHKGESYCVIAWYADGHAEQSEVWQY